MGGWVGLFFYVCYSFSVSLMVLGFAKILVIGWCCSKICG